MFAFRLGPHPESLSSTTARRCAPQEVGASAPTKEDCQFFFLSRASPVYPDAGRVRTRTSSGGRGLSPDKRVLLILLPIVRLIRANGFGQHEFCHSLFDLSLAAASYVSQPSVSLLRSCQGTASAVPKDKTDAILPIARFTRANGFGLHGFGLDFCVRLSLFEFRSSNFVFRFLRVNDAAAILR